MSLTKEQRLVNAVKRANPVNLRRSLEVLQRSKDGYKESWAFLEGVEIMELAVEISEKR